MRSAHAWAAVVGCIAAISCSGVSAKGPTDRKSAEAAMIKADEAFCQATVDHDVARFRSLVSGEATFAGGTPGQTRGIEAIVKSWMPFLQPGGPTLTWKPTHAEVLAGAEVGDTVGTWERRVETADGQMSIAHGQYMTVWRRQSDGKWKAVFDTGGEEP